MSDSFQREKPEKPVDCLSLQKWIDNRKEKYENQWWAQIGEEVLARKTLWLTAAEELKSQEIPGVNAYNLAATDVFVEKAQKAISERAKSYLKVGGFVSLITSTLMIATAVFLYSNIKKDLPADLAPLPFCIMVIKMATVGALIGGVGYFLIGIARAFLHEGTALYDRRHALRFGRLYVYLTGGNVKLPELEAAFNWNKEIYTAFKDIRADKATKSVVQLISEMGVEAIKTGAVAVKAGRRRASQVE
jgi:hypothetical protein